MADLMKQSGQSDRTTLFMRLGVFLLVTWIVTGILSALPAFHQSFMAADWFQSGTLWGGIAAIVAAMSGRQKKTP